MSDEKAWMPTSKVMMRIGDKERNDVIEVLSRHMAAGRLTHEEYEERMGRAVEAKTEGDLAGLLDDLPPESKPLNSKEPTSSGVDSLLVFMVAAVTMGMTLLLFHWVAGLLVLLLVGLPLVVTWRSSRQAVNGNMTLAQRASVPRRPLDKGFFS